MDPFTNPDSSSTSPSTTMIDHTNIDLCEFPLELLKAILAKLIIAINPNSVTREEAASWRGMFLSLLRYRQVCALWKKVMDQVLEECIIFTMQWWIPNRLRDELFPRSVFKLIISPAFEQKNDVTNFYPPCLDTYSGKNPFPGRCSLVSCDNPRWTYNGVPFIVNDLIVRFAHHLSVICLHELVLCFYDFKNILKACKNIKALVLDTFGLVIGDDDELQYARLPLLPSLQTLLLLDRFRVYKCVVDDDGKIQIPWQDKQDCNIWLFNGYYDQLKKLEFRHNPKFQIDPLPKLKQLSLVIESVLGLNQLGPLLKLERLSISGCSGLSNNDYIDVFELFMFIGQFSNSLNELYLDVDLFREKGLFERDDIEYKHQHAHLLFPHVCKLTLPYPEVVEKENMLLEYILPKFPFLKELNLLLYVKFCYPSTFYYSNETDYPASPPFMNNIWPVCAELKNTYVLKRVLFNPIRNFIYTRSVFRRPVSL